LEQQANAILQNRASPLEDRSKAYKVIEKVAENTSSGNNAHLWMAYRYREGDGVTKDTILEHYWQDRHDGKASSTTPKGSSE
jgi:NADH:ubiquinone oxidoreductase subunit